MIKDYLQLIMKSKYKTLFIIVTLLNIIYCFCFQYEDTVAYLNHSIYFFDTLFSGNVFDFYKYTSEDLRNSGVPGCHSSFLVLVPWIIFNIPIYLFHINSKLSVTSPYCIFYSKIILFIISVVITYYIYKIISSL